MSRQTVADLDDLTEADFECYEAVRRSGVCNMWSPEVERIAGISTEVKVGIIRHYEALCAKWPHIRNLEDETP